jgi:L-aminopeptidase/D-esterase-like protein
VEGDGATGGISQRGGSPGTRETDLLNPLNRVDKVNAVVLAGGSAFGLDAAAGAMRWLEDRRIGWDTRAGRIPIVPAAILYDLDVGDDPRVRPTAECGYLAADSASAAPVGEGTVGAGAGATVGKFGGGQGMKGGIGSASFALPNGLVVGAIAAVNAVGDIVDPKTGQIVAGSLTPDGTFLDVRRAIHAGTEMPPARPGENTTIVVVATNAKLSKSDTNWIALMADDGIARAIYPSHTVSDGDTVFALATGQWDGASSATDIGALAADAVAEAIVRAVTQATSVAGIPAARDRQHN